MGGGGGILCCACGFSFCVSLSLSSVRERPGASLSLPRSLSLSLCQCLSLVRCDMHTSSLGLNCNSKSGTSPLHLPKEFGPVKCWRESRRKEIVDLAVDRDAHAPHREQNGVLDDVVLDAPVIAWQLGRCEGHAVRVHPCSGRRADESPHELLQERNLQAQVGTEHHVPRVRGEVKVAIWPGRQESLGRVRAQRADESHSAHVGNRQG